MDIILYQYRYYECTLISIDAQPPLQFDMCRGLVIEFVGRRTQVRFSASALCVCLGSRCVICRECYLADPT